MQIEPLSPPSDELKTVADFLNLNDIWVQVNDLGASARHMHRRDIRRSLIEFLTQLLKERKIEPEISLAEALSELMPLSDLETIPETRFASMSLAHCPLNGGFWVVPGETNIGFDVEVNDRVSPAVAQRIGQPDELFEASESTSLWVAKESAFKSLYNKNQPNTLSEITTSDWQQPHQNVQTFSFKTNHSNDLVTEGKGAIVSMDRFKMGFARI